MRHLTITIILALLVGIIAPPAAGQDVKDWDEVTQPQFDSPATNDANSRVGVATSEYLAAEEALDNLDCSICQKATPFYEAKDAAGDDYLEAVDDLVDARIEAIDAAPVEGGLDQREAQLEAKVDALDSVEDYAAEEEVDATDAAVISAEVEAELEAVQAEREANREAREAAQAPETTQAPEATQPPAESQGGGDQDAAPVGGESPAESPPEPQGIGPLSPMLSAGVVGFGAALVLGAAVAIMARRQPRKPTRANVAPPVDDDYDGPMVGGEDE